MAGTRDGAVYRILFTREQSPAGARSNLRFCRLCVLDKKARLDLGFRRAFSREKAKETILKVLGEARSSP
jgi:hypothetical protein